MIYKVLYQETKYEVPVRESTKATYLEAESEREVRAKLADRGWNIEYVEGLEGNYLEYEQRSDDFKVEQV